MSAPRCDIATDPRVMSAAESADLILAADRLMREVAASEPWRGARIWLALDFFQGHRTEENAERLRREMATP